MRSHALVMALSACGQPGTTSAVCEQAFERALEQHAVYVAEVMAETPTTEHAELRRRAAEEAGLLARRFIPACEADSDFRPGCFASIAASRSTECRVFVPDFFRETLR